MLTDHVSDLLFIHSPEARDNLLREGIAEHRIHAVGNTMVDTLVAMRARFRQAGAAVRHGLQPGGYLVVTLHRPALVDGPLLADAVTALDDLTDHMPIVFPVHPRTAAAMQSAGLRFASERVRLLDPLGYVEFLSLVIRRRRADRLWRDAGGDDVSRRPVLHAARQHRTARHV